MLLAAALSGCLAEQPNASQLEQIFGAANVETVMGLALIKVPVLEGQVMSPDVNGTWSASPKATVDGGKITLSKQNPGPQGGGGTTQDLKLANANATLSVRFLNASQLAGFEIHWFAVKSSGDGAQNLTAENSTAHSVTKGSETFTTNFTLPGTLSVYAHIYSGKKLVGLTLMPLTAGVGAKWVVESTVFPSHPGGLVNQARPANYDKMADYFNVQFTGIPASMSLQTSYRGTYTAGSGADVDLGLYTKGGAKGYICAGSGGGGTPTPSKEQASETIQVEGLMAEAWQIQVGAMQNPCPQTVGGTPISSWYYANSSQVPYTLNVLIEF
jgi:hypothetical protein